MRVGKPLLSCEAALRLTAVGPSYINFFQPRKQAESGQQPGAAFASFLALRERAKPPTASQRKKTNRTTEPLLLSSFSVLCRFLNNHNNNTRPLGCIAPHPLGAFCLLLAMHRICVKLLFACVINHLGCCGNSAVHGD